MMRVEIIDDMEGLGHVEAFPSGEHFVDLRKNPHAVEQIAPARQFQPLNIFLTAVNSLDSLFSSASAGTRADSPASVSTGEAYEFACQTRLVFAKVSLNFNRDGFVDLASGLKELLERDSGDAIRAVLRISRCDFPVEKHRGFCLSIRLVAHGASVEQAEMRCGLGLVLLQQALLFSGRALRQQFDR
jgi:hypothetical protein